MDRLLDLTISDVQRGFDETDVTHCTSLRNAITTRSELQSKIGAKLELRFTAAKLELTMERPDEF